MPRLNNMRERHHQPYWDTLIRVQSNTAPSPTVSQTTRLFATGTNLGQTEWTNMLAAGQLPSDQSYIVLALRVWLWFKGTSALAVYQLCVNQIYLSLVMGDKSQFAAPCWFFPSGGGIFGYDSATPAMVNGVPSAESILKFGKPIPMPPRQNFYVETTCYDMGTLSLRTNYLNSSTSICDREIKVFIDGLHTRDVQ
jgi:hypothetical protein